MISSHRRHRKHCSELRVELAKPPSLFFLFFLLRFAHAVPPLFSGLMPSAPSSFTPL
jgi:hypothetical protein